MNMTRDRIQSIGWFTLLAVCTVLTGSLMLRVNAVKSRVEISQRQIIALRRQTQFLETEYETRANQQQLSAINDLEFGYKAPDSRQYLENERQLAMLGKPRGADAPSPIELARADDTNIPANGGDSSPAAGSLRSLVPELTGRLIDRAMAAEAPRATPRAPALQNARIEPANLRERLARIDPPEHSE